jgi:hypothetical protein
MNTITTVLSSRAARASERRLRWARCTLVALLAWGANVQAGSGEREACLSDDGALSRQLASATPPNPEILIAALRLRSEGVRLCRNGEVDAGRTKLGEAAELAARGAGTLPQIER